MEDNPVYNLAGINDDETLGRLIPGFHNMPPSSKADIRRAAQTITVKAAQQAAPNKQKLRFIAGASNLPAPVKSSADTGELKWRPYDFYVRQQITFASTRTFTELIDANLDKTAGITNLPNKNKMPNNETMLVTHIKLMFGYDPTGTITNPAAVTYYNLTDQPACIQNGELSLRLGREQLFENRPVSSMLPTGPDSVVNAIDLNDSAYELGIDNAYWHSQQEMLVTWHHAGVAAPAGNWFIHFEVVGIGIGA
jgi:hypothetical protein